MLTKVAMHASDYDAKLIPSPILTELTREMHVLMDNAMCDILGWRKASGVWCSRQDALEGLERIASREAIGLTQPAGPRGTCTHK